MFYPSCEVNARSCRGRRLQPLVSHARKEATQIFQLPRRASLELAPSCCDFMQGRQVPAGEGLHKLAQRLPIGSESDDN